MAQTMRLRYTLPARRSSRQLIGRGVFLGSPEALELGGPRENLLDTIFSGFRLSNIDEWHLKGRGITGIHEWHP